MEECIEEASVIRHPRPVIPSNPRDPRPVIPDDPEIRVPCYQLIRVL
jgi:hypothetical protein